MSKFVRQIEGKIKSKINGIKNGNLEPKGLGVNDMLKRLKEIDEASAEKLQKDYIEAVRLNKNY